MLKKGNAIAWVMIMISSITELANMKTNDEGVVMMADAKVTVTKDEYDTTFEVETRNRFYTRRVSVPNNLIEMLANNSITSNRILYYMAGYSPRMTLKGLTTVDTIIGRLL